MRFALRARGLGIVERVGLVKWVSSRCEPYGGTSEIRGWAGLDIGIYVQGGLSELCERPSSDLGL